MSSEGQFTAFTRAIIQYFIITTFTGASQQYINELWWEHRSDIHRQRTAFIGQSNSVIWLTVGLTSIHTALYSYATALKSVTDNIFPIYCFVSGAMKEIYH